VQGNGNGAGQEDVVGNNQPSLTQEALSDGPNNGLAQGHSQMHQGSGPVRRFTDDSLQFEPQPNSQQLSTQSLGALDAQQVSLEGGGPHAPDFAQSPSTTTSFATGTAPYQWYELIARDAWKNAEQYQFLTSHTSRWSFNLDSDADQAPMLQHRSPTLSNAIGSPHIQRSTSIRIESFNRPTAAQQPWNTPESLILGGQDIDYLQHYVNVVCPLLDLFDESQKHFANYVLHLALRNEGLLKAVLAVSASHRASHPSETQRVSVDSLLSSQADPTPRSHREQALQYYYETLAWLSQAMRIPGFVNSEEILANAALISWYEAFESDSSPNWERHLKGVFWLQRQRNSDGESLGLPGAIWWSWLQQDIWAAFRHGRRTLTIWKPTKTLKELDQENLVRHILYTQAKAVSYASPEAIENVSFEQRMSDAEELLAILVEWHALLPRQCQPIPISVNDATGDVIYKPIWIHPPRYAAAVQAYNVTKLLVVLNKPSRGGRQEYQERQNLLEISVDQIAGIASAPNANFPPLAVVNSQALFICK
jgi:hypothetical protein